MTIHIPWPIIQWTAAIFLSALVLLLAHWMLGIGAMEDDRGLWLLMGWAGGFAFGGTIFLAREK